jgi:hypothetical protein
LEIDLRDANNAAGIMVLFTNQGSAAGDCEQKSSYWNGWEKFKGLA